METYRYITRYNGKKGTRNTFCGWRLCMTRQKETYVRYFTDREFESEQAALEAALSIRDAMLAELESGVCFEEVCKRYQKSRNAR
ncbi:MAG: hypothetical protein IKA23_08155 [Akkermansia sp.]|nr:hypothetical protein [Akkermansia sp.]MBR2313823.1 hypothetical protein [Akkermansia sp.]